MNHLVRRKLIVANWKMHLNVAQSSLLVHRLNTHIKTHRDIEVVLAPSMLALQPLSLQIDRRKFRLALQDAHPADEGAFTGEVSFTMARGLVHYGIVGHSSRRIYFNESLELIRDKVAAAVRNGITPVLCVGETKEERRNGETRKVVHGQIVSALHNLTAEEVAAMVIAYEPIWAISTFDGEIAKPHVIQKEIDHVRDQVGSLYGDVTGRTVRVLYGGSVDEFDARSYLELEGCDGVLVGAASLNYHKFTGIVDSAYRMVHSE
jgi:triosephosphate isomerase (TIM)